MGIKRIIDFHTHMGDIFHEQKNITFKKIAAIDHKPYIDPFKNLEESGYNDPLIVDDEEKQNILIDAGQYRVWENGGLAAIQKSMDENLVAYSVSYPILPNTSFEEALAASKLDERIIPFTSADFSLPIPLMRQKLIEDIALGAKGLKLHPILQNCPLNDERAIAATEIFGERNLPVIPHVGVNDYYKSDSPYIAISPKEYGELDYFFEFVRRFPDYPIIAAHAGGNCGWELDVLAAKIKEEGWKNVYADTTFKNAATMFKMVELIGEDRVLFGTDYPFATIKYSILECEKAFAGAPDILDKVFYTNAARLLNL